MKAKMPKVINHIVVDTNVLTVLYSASFEENLGKERYSNEALILDHAKNGRIKLYVTPSILTEFLLCRGKKQHKTIRFDEFMSDYINFLEYSDQQLADVATITYLLGNKKVRHFSNHENRMVNKVLAIKANHELDKNYTDTRIIAEAHIHKLPILTENTKDFKVYKLVNLVSSQVLTDAKPGIIMNTNQYVKHLNQNLVNEREHSL